MVYYCEDCRRNWEDATFAIFKWRYIEKISLKICPKCQFAKRDKGILGAHPTITIIDDPIRKIYDEKYMDELK